MSESTIARPAAGVVTPVPASPPPVTVPETAAERLAKSREQIRDSIAAAAVPVRPVAIHSGPLSSTVHTVLDKAKTVPGVNIVVDAARTWWRYHPWRAVGAVAADASRVAVTPVANRHPVVLVLGAALFGAMLLRWGPWRWAAKRTLIAGLVPALATRVAASVPMESWLSALALLRRKRSARHESGSV